MEVLTIAIETQQIVVLISADAEWEMIKETTIPLGPVLCSPFGEWFLHDLNVRNRKLPVMFFETGCGKIPAAASTQFVLDKWNPPLIINLGTCGGFGGKVKKGDILLVTKTVVYDICERTGRHDDQIAKYTTDLDLSWLEKPYPMDATPVTMATADQDLDPEIIPFLQERHGAVAADWESGAIAYVAHKKNKRRCLIVRGVSDVVALNGEPSREEEIREGIRTIMWRLSHGLPEWIVKASLRNKFGSDYCQLPLI